ncbi:MAG: hypothetical protein CL526_04150 [Aequorivita sp.]|nr:hypothetical protein [Aequorivita sp.]|tara:strand:+ start:153 stop:818 length:666 start_codon:yes stop_codon:yes gene_type:complete
MRNSWIFILLTLFTINSKAQIGSVIGSKNGNKKVVAKTKKPLQFSTEKLAYKITRNAKTEKQKVEAISNWIGHNISYDNELRLSKALQKEIYTSESNVIKNVLERNMALCGGYAFLFKSLCNDVGISAVSIHGFTRNYSAEISNREKPNHTWNAVKIDGQWQLLDLTWAISYGNNKAMDDFWIFTNPTNFIYTHYPLEPKWTLLENDETVSISWFNSNNLK